MTTDSAQPPSLTSPPGRAWPAPAAAYDPNRQAAPPPPHPTGTSVPSRIAWVDVAKGIGILLVVVGHTLRGLVSGSLAPADPLVQRTDEWIYAFHMPLFFVLSGLHLARAFQKPFPEIVKDRAIRLLYPYAIWATGQYVAQSLASSAANQATPIGDVWRIVYEPPMQFWYIYVLFVLSVLFGALWKAGLREWMLLALGLAGFFLMPYLVVGTWAVQVHVLYYSVYLALGMVFGLPKNMASISATSASSGVACALAGFGFVTFGVAYFAGNATPLGRLGLAICGLIATLGLSVAIMPTLAGRVFEFLGKYSLPIYLAHTIISAAVRIALVKVLKVHDFTLHMVLGTLTGLLIPIGMAIACERLNFPYLFEWPRKRRASSRPAKT